MLGRQRDRRRRGRENERVKEDRWKEGGIDKVKKRRQNWRHSASTGDMNCRRRRERREREREREREKKERERQREREGERERG